MNELILNYNLLDAMGKQEVLDFLKFLVQKRQKSVVDISLTDYKQQIMQVSVWSEEDIAEMKRNAESLKFETPQW